MNVFDFDNTIYRGDSTVDFVFFNFKKQPSLLRFVPGIVWAYLLHAMHFRNKTETKQAVFNMFPSIRNIDDRLAEFWETHFTNIKTWYPGVQKEDDVIVSAGPEFLVTPCCRRLGIKNIIGSRVDPVTGQYSGENCSDEEKVVRFRESFPGAEIQNFFSDSLSDTPLALLAQQAYLVRGDDFLPWPAS